MKNAMTPDGEPVVADSHAPASALCPDCGGEVYLRSRKKMGSRSRTYFWQHERGTGNSCGPKRRVRPVADVVDA